jgi:hypothetical protein
MKPAALRPPRVGRFWRHDVGANDVSRRKIMDFLSQLLRGIAFVPALVSGIEGLFGDKPGAEKKDAAMSFLQNALAMTDAVAAREIINPENFKNGISKIIDGTVECLNASTWCKQPPASNSQPSALTL